MSTIPMTGEFIKESVDLHLFWARIMKENAIFNEDSFECKDAAWIQEAENFKCQFEAILYEFICLANGIVSVEVFKSGELFTDKTLIAEQKMIELSCIQINTQLTIDTMNLQPSRGIGMIPAGSGIEEKIFALNEQALACAQAMVVFWQQVYDNVTKACCLFTHNLPAIFQHQIDETKLYIKQIQRIQSGQMVDPTFYRVEMIMFWNKHLMEYAEIIRQLLDPTEEALIDQANMIIKEFKMLNKQFQDGTQPKANLKQLSRESMAATVNFIEFISRITELILACQLKSVISALLGDHVLREAFHYLRILQMPLPEFKGGRG